MLSDCEKCWETPCICGWDYRNRSAIYRVELASVVLGISPKILIERLPNEIFELIQKEPNGNIDAAAKNI